jgi:xanthine dehydrogenase YagR molybdenum-binding subunit
MAPRSMRDGNWLVGMGMATATYPARQLPASARVTIKADGTAIVQVGTQDLGTGTYTVMTQVAADELGIAFDKITFELGDTALPEAPLSAGSMTVSTVGSAVKVACHKAKAELAAKGGKGDVTVEHHNDPSKDHDKWSMHSHGAVFAEVKVDEDLGLIRVTRVVAAYAGGQILNAKTARSQLLGGIVWSIGMALEEETMRDPKTGRVISRDLADYHVPVHADVPDIQIITVDEKDPHVNEIGAKGLGEIGNTGASAAIANAVFHATGKRVRDLPIRLDKLLPEVHA